MKFLLDTNVLIASIWGHHSGHATAKRWAAGKELFVCPIAELGFIRISTSKAWNTPMDKARKALEGFLASAKVDRIPDDLPALESHPGTTNQVTDHYLADLAAQHGLKLATFDQGIGHPAVEILV